MRCCRSCAAARWGFHAAHCSRRWLCSVLACSKCVGTLLQEDSLQRHRLQRHRRTHRCPDAAGYLARPAAATPAPLQQSSWRPPNWTGRAARVNPRASVLCAVEPRSRRQERTCTRTPATHLQLAHSIPVVGQPILSASESICVGLGHQELIIPALHHWLSPCAPTLSAAAGTPACPQAL